MIIKRMIVMNTTVMRPAMAAAARWKGMVCGLISSLNAARAWAFTSTNGEGCSGVAWAECTSMPSSYSEGRASANGYSKRSPGQLRDAPPGSGIAYADLRLVIHANCRAQFTADDFTFVVRTLARSQRDAVSLVSLLSDEAERDAILDHEMVYRSLIDDGGCLRVSAAFYFYVLTRRVLRQVGVEERALSDYVAAVLLAFSNTSQLRAHNTEPVTARSFTYVSDLLAQLAACPPAESFVRRTHLANYVLFVSGMFAERITSHAERRGAPGLSFYESVGQSAYLHVAQHPQARRAELNTVFEQLGSGFQSVRMALNRLTDSFLHLHAPPSILITPP